MDGVLGVIYQFTVARKDSGRGTILTRRLLDLIQPFLHHDLEGQLIWNKEVEGHSVY